MEITTYEQLQTCIGAGPYVFPGGHEKLYIADDGEFLCHGCVEQEKDRIRASMDNECNDGWRVVGVETTEGYEPNEMAICAHCYHPVKRQ